MTANEDITEEVEPETPGSDTKQSHGIKEVTLVVEIFRSSIRIIVLSIIALVFLRLDTLVTGEIAVLMVSFILEMLPMTLLLITVGTVVVGILVFLNDRISISNEKRNEVNKIIHHFDFIVSSVLVTVSIFLLPTVMDWITRLSFEFQSNAMVLEPIGPIYWLPSLFDFISRFVIFEIVEIISMVLIYGAIFYRFATRAVMFLDGENKFTLTYTERSGKSYLYAIGLTISYAFVVLDSITAEMFTIYLMIFLLPFALAQRHLAKKKLDTNEEDKSKTLETSLDKITQWYSFATKRTYRWLILIGIFVSLSNASSIMGNPNWDLFSLNWEFVFISAITAVGFSTLYFLSRFYAVNYLHQESVIGKRIWIESAADLIVTAVLLVVSLTMFVTEIGLNQWAQMQRHLQFTAIHYGYRFLSNLQILITSTLWQVWMILLMFADKNYEKELRNNKLLSRSGKVLIMAIASLLSVTWLIKGTLFFGFVTDFQVSLLLTLLILQTVISQLRVREIKMTEGGSK